MPWPWFLIPLCINHRVWASKGVIPPPEGPDNRTLLHPACTLTPGAAASPSVQCHSVWEGLELSVSLWDCTALLWDMSSLSPAAPLTVTPPLLWPCLFWKTKALQIHFAGLSFLRSALNVANGRGTFKGLGCCVCLQIFSHAQVGSVWNKCRSKMQREISLANKKKRKKRLHLAAPVLKCLLKYLEKCRWKGALELTQSSPLPKTGLSEGPEGKCTQPTHPRTSFHSLCRTFPSPAARTILLPVHKQMGGVGNSQLWRMSFI